QGWLGGAVDQLPDVFLRDLRQQWNAWLQRRYATTEKLRQAWGVKEEPPGKEMLSNTDLAKGVEGWVLERHEKAEAKVTADDELPDALKAGSPRPRSARISVTHESTMGWHVQFNQAGLKVEAERPYTLTFWAKADRPLPLSVGLGQAHAPWGTLGLSREVKLTTDWQQFRFVFLPGQADDNARVNFSDLARQTCTVWLAGGSLAPGGCLRPGASA